MSYEKPITKRNLNMIYPNMEIPDVTAAPVEGTHYKAFVPDTYDVAERAKASIHSLLGMTCPESDYESYLSFVFQERPPRFNFAYDNVTCQPKIQEAIALLRKCTGSDEYMEVDQRWKELMIQTIGPDGLPYYPLVGRPFGDSIPESTDGLLASLKDRSKGMFTSPISKGKIASAMILTGMEDGDPRWTELAKGIVDGIIRLTTDRGEYAYMMDYSLSPEFETGIKQEVKTTRTLDWVTTAGGGWTGDYDEEFGPRDGYWATLHGFLLQSFVQVYRMIGYEPALTYAKKFAEYIMRVGLFEEDGRFALLTHFHLHCTCVQGLADLALLTGDKKYEEFALKCYNYGKSDGNTIVGFFAEGQHKPDGRYFAPGSIANGFEPMETCELAEMVTLALMFGQLGYDECWDDADKWIRNQFAEAQLMKTDWIPDMLETPGHPKTGIKPFETADHVLERIVGAFGSLCGASSFVDDCGDGAALAVCCQGNGARALYYIWDNIIDFKNDVFYVNLCLNRASRWADVNSYIPYEGQVDVVMKEAVEVRVRIPGWADLNKVKCYVDGKEVPFTYDGRYACVGKMEAGVTVSVKFPIEEKVVKTFIGGKPFTLKVKGADVVDIEPRGKWGGYYKREHYREDKVRWVERDRFVCDRQPEKY